MTDKWMKKLWFIYTMEYYSAIKQNAFESVLVRQMSLGATPRLRSGVAGRSHLMPEARGSGQEEQPKERWLRGRRRA